jgi:PTH2 family peptidyl-tRNA hydrolase
MSAGKAAAQTAHAARMSLLRYLQIHPDRAAEFTRLNTVGSLVVLTAPSLVDLEKLAIRADSRLLPWALFVDSGHICPNFDGSPITTALAIGPAARQSIRALVRAYSCL